MPIRWPLPQRQQAVDRADARRQRLVDAGTAARVRRGPVERGAVAERRLRPVVDGVALGVDHAAQQVRPDAQPARGAHQPHAIAAAHALQVAQRIEHRQVVAEADHFGQQRHARLPLDFGHGPHRRRKPGRRNRGADRPRNTAHQRRGHDVVELFGKVGHGEGIRD